MNNPLGVSPSNGNQGTFWGKEKNLLTPVGIEPTTSGLDLPLLCRLSYEGESRERFRSDRESRGRFRWWIAQLLLFKKNVGWPLPLSHANAIDITSGAADLYVASRK